MRVIRKVVQDKYLSKACQDSREARSGQQTAKLFLRLTRKPRLDAGAAVANNAI
jgi:hypothetical protein